MKYTLLDIVQTILSSLDSDEVNSIGDSVEAQQAAIIARTSYMEIATRGGLRESKTLFELEASNDINLPTVMYRPSDIQNVDWIKYNRATAADPMPQFEIIPYLCLEDFLDRMYGFPTDMDNTGTGTLQIGDDSITIMWKNDIGPSYWTSYNDNILLFDSYDSVVDDTLKKNKVIGYGQSGFEFRMEDTFVPNLDEIQHQLWLNESKSLAWAELKQTQHGKAEMGARKGWVNLMKSKRALPTHTSELDKAPNYSRGANGGLYRRTYTKFSDRW